MANSKYFGNKIYFILSDLRKFTRFSSSGKITLVIYEKNKTKIKFPGLGGFRFVKFLDKSRLSVLCWSSKLYLNI